MAEDEYKLWYLCVLSFNTEQMHFHCSNFMGIFIVPGKNFTAI